MCYERVILEYAQRELPLVRFGSDSIPQIRKEDNSAPAKSLQSCPTLWDPTDGSPPGFSVPGILQAGTLAWVAISFSNAWKWKVKVKSLSRVRLLATPWTVAYQAPPSMGFSRQEYWSGLPLPSPRRTTQESYKILSLSWLFCSSLPVTHCILQMGMSFLEC